MISSSRTDKIIYWAATIYMILIMVFSFVTYHVSHEQMSQFFINFNYPEYIVYPLAYLKLTAVLVILVNRYRNLRDIAYGAYYLNVMMATVAHLVAGDNPVHAYIALVAVPISYIYSNRVRGEPTRDAFILK